MTLTRNTSLDILKGVAALFVIWIHERFPGVTGQLINRIGTFAVPVFFMVSGYYRQNASRGKLEKSIRHILTLIGIAYSLNLFRILVFDGGTAMLDALISAFSPRTLILWILLNITPISGVAWFLFALLYCYILHWVFHRWITDHRGFLLIPVCIAGGLAVHLLMPSIGTNNAWFCGIPCYLIGSWYRVNQEHLSKIPISQYIAGAVLGLGMLIGSVFAMDFLSYPAAFVTAASLFGLCIRFPGGRNRLLQRIGSTYSFFVYIGHALMIHVFNAIVPVGDNVLLAWTRPVLIAAATIGCAAFWHDIIRRRWK